MENDTNPSRHVPKAEQPKGDLGEKGKTWNPGEKQGISNREGDQNTDALEELHPNATKH